jgi:hypothetical protein
VRVLPSSLHVSFLLSFSPHCLSTRFSPPSLWDAYPCIVVFDLGTGCAGRAPGAYACAISFAVPMPICLLVYMCRLVHICAVFAHICIRLRLRLSRNHHLSLLVGHTTYDIPRIPSHSSVLPSRLLICFAFHSPSTPLASCGTSTPFASTPLFTSFHLTSLKCDASLLNPTAYFRIVSVPSCHLRTYMSI